MSQIPDPLNLPHAMTALPNWVAWRTEAREEGGKATKIPYSIATEQRAASTKPEDWCGYPSPDQFPEGYDGIGFVLSKESGIVGIDLDDCLTSTLDIKDWALPILQEFRDTYCEISPSGTGVKIFAGGTLPSEKGTKIYIGADGKPTKTRVSDEAVEIYSWGRYFAVTGRSIACDQVGTVQTSIDNLYKMMAGVRGEHKERVAPVPGETVEPGSRHGHLLAVAGKLRNEGFDRDALIVTIGQLNRRVCNPPKPHREVEGIVDFVMNKPTQYRLTPQDFKTEQAKAATGEVFDLPRKEPAAVVTDDIVAYAEDLLVAAIESKDVTKVLGEGVEPSELIQALAQAGNVKQHEARRRIKAAFKGAVPMGELNARLKAVEDAMEEQRVEQPAPFLLSAEGSIIANLANAMTMMSELPVKFNSFTQCTFLTAPAPWGSVGVWTDYDDLKAAEWCQRKLLNIPHQLAGAAIEAVAKDRVPHYHPVREYLTSLNHDGIPRIDRWLTDYLGVTLDGYSAAVGRKWLISAVKRVFEPGCQADYTLVLEGAQGKMKSTALRALCGDEFFTDDVGDIRNKDSAIQLQGNWIVEFSELDAFRSADMTTIKAWLVRRADNFRPPYGRRSGKFDRQNVFAATTNKEKWLADETGGRRFWPVKVGKVDLQGLRANRDQIWAEACVAHENGEAPFLTDIGESLATSEQQERQESDVWTDPVMQWVDEPSASVYPPRLESTAHRVLVCEILQHALRKEPGHWTQRESRRVTGILRSHGYQTKRASKRDGGKEFWIHNSE